MGLKITSVTLSVERACLDLPSALVELAEELGPGPESRLIFLPPLVATISGLNVQRLTQEGLDPAVREAATSRRRRAMAVWFTYPRASAQRRRWLVHHDRVHETLRGPIAQLARDLGCSVVAGTSLLDHPRTHWEAWPHNGGLFHSAWSFGPDGEPFDVLRDAAPAWGVLKEAKPDPSRAGSGGVLNTPCGPVAVNWGQGAPEEGVLEWQPRATAGPASSLPTSGPTRPWVVSSLHGLLGERLVDDTQIRSAGFTMIEARPPADSLSAGLGWCSAQL